MGEQGAIRSGQMGHLWVATSRCSLPMLHCARGDRAEGRVSGEQVGRGHFMTHLGQHVTRYRDGSAGAAADLGRWDEANAPHWYCLLPYWAETQGRETAEPVLDSEMRGGNLHLHQVGLEQG